MSLSFRNFVRPPCCYYGLWETWLASGICVNTLHEDDNDDDNNYNKVHPITCHEGPEEE